MPNVLHTVLKLCLLASHNCTSAQGTATDAVVLDSKHNPPQVLAKAKVPTTPDVLSGISAALQQLQQQCPASFSAVVGVFLGTTQFVNAVVQLQGLAKVFVVRLCGTATHALPPFVGMPTELREAVAAGYVLSAGVS
jgi:N-methylhydantoinase A/oxoprolinase/acetone carboxylase beta subunit